MRGFRREGGMPPVPEQSFFGERVQNIKESLLRKGYQLIPYEQNYDSLEKVIEDHLQMGGLSEKYQDDPKKLERIIEDAIISDGGFVEHVSTGAESPATITAPDEQEDGKKDVA